LIGLRARSRAPKLISARFIWHWLHELRGSNRPDNALDQIVRGFERRIVEAVVLAADHLAGVALDRAREDGQAQRIVKVGDTSPAGETAERAKKIRRAVLQKTTMIDYLLDSSRLIENGAQLYFHPEVVDLRELLQEVCHLHREIAPRTPIAQRLGTVGTTSYQFSATPSCCFRCSAI
jgi:signal transduction histidine kinase